MSFHHTGILTGALLLLLTGGCVLPGQRPPRDALTPAEHLALGVTYEQGGEYALALREYERAAVGPAPAGALACQGNVHLARGDLPAAEARYRAALAADPDHLVALNNLAWLLVRQGGPRAEAERLIRRALALNPEPREPYEDTLRAVLQLP